MNILWILTTQWRAQACGFAGSSDANTPALDDFAREALNLSQAVTPHPFGPFARAAILTGIRSPPNGVREYYDPLPSGTRTIAHDLNDRGYQTAFFGKWHLARRDPAAPLVGDEHARQWVPEEARGGFRFWEGFEGGFQLNDPWLHGTRLPEPTKFRGYQSDVVCARAANWVTEQSNAAWFCVVSLEPPHPPYDAAPGPRRYDPKKLSVPANVPTGGATEARARRELAGYYEHISATDRAIGELLRCIDRSTTLVVFTSVHGDMHGAHGLFRKGWPHEESVRVPLLIGAPGGGAQRLETAFSLDALPTLTRNFAATGELVLPSERWAQISMPSVVKLPDQCDRVWRGVRSHDRKLVVDGDGTPWLFFNLAEDPLEMNNRVGDLRCAGEIESWRKRLPA